MGIPGEVPGGISGITLEEHSNGIQEGISGEILQRIPNVYLGAISVKMIFYQDKPRCYLGLKI